MTNKYYLYRFACTRYIGSSHFPSLKESVVEVLPQACTHEIKAGSDAVWRKYCDGHSEIVVPVTSIERQNVTLPRAGNVLTIVIESCRRATEGIIQPKSTSIKG